MDHATRSLLVGRRPDLTRRYLVFGLGVFIIWAGYLLSDWVVIVPLWVLALILVGLPAVQAYQNDGLLVCVTLGLIMALGFYLPLTIFNLAYPNEDLLWGLGASLMFGVPTGVLGFGLGAGANRLREHVS